MDYLINDPEFLAAKSIAEQHNFKYVRQHSIEGRVKYVPTYDRVGVIVFTNSSVDMDGRAIGRKAA